MKFICLFFPALLASYGEIKSSNNNLLKFKVYCEYCLYINFIMLVFLIIIGKSSVHFEDLRTVRFYVIYFLGSIILAKVLPSVIKFCKANFKFKIRRKIDEKDSEIF